MDLLPLALQAQADGGARSVLADAILESRWAPVEVLEAMHPDAHEFNACYLNRYRAVDILPAIAVGHWFRIVSGEIKDTSVRCFGGWHVIALRVLQKDTALPRPYPLSPIPRNDFRWWSSTLRSVTIDDLV